jgi:hypothetical protein
MHNPIRVLAVNPDRRLLDSRALLLQGFHYQVNTATDYRQVQSIPAPESFEVAVIEQLDPLSELDSVTRLIRTRWPRAKILIFSRGTLLLDDALYDERVDSFQLGELITGIARLAERSTVHESPPWPI